MLFILFFAGMLAGFINTLAGGGSLLVLPILILLGIPSPIANATNRVAILFQSATGSYRFNKFLKLDIKSSLHIIIAVIFGSIIGSSFAVKISSAYFDKILAGVLMLMLILMLRPHKITKKRVLPKWLEFIIFLIVGFYGGFIQVGIGFTLLAILNLVEEFDLLKANAVKVFIVMCYTIFTVIIFAINGQIIWKYGLILAVGNIIGAFVGVKFAFQKGEKFIKFVLVLAVILACLKLLNIF